MKRPKFPTLNPPSFNRENGRLRQPRSKHSRLHAWPTLALLSALALLFPLRAPARASSVDEKRVDTTVNAMSQRFLAAHPRTIGMSIGVLYQGVAYRYNFGSTSRATHQSATADTSYPIASITKTFTAALLAQAALDHKLAIDDDVRHYLDGKYANLSYKTHPIRLYDLLDHRSGLPFFLPDRPEAQPDYNNNAVPFLTRLATLRRGYSANDFYRDLHRVTLNQAPGSEPPHYSNAGAELVARILEKLYAKPYSLLLQETILTPLDMRSTCLAPACPKNTLRPEAYDHAGQELPEDTAPLGAAGAVRSSVNDLLKYLHWQQDPANQVATLSHKPRIVLGDYAVGLNWQMWTAGGRHLIWQSGNVPGFGSLCLIEKEPKIALVILMNGVDDATTDGKEALANDIVAQLDPNAVLLPQ